MEVECAAEEGKKRPREDEGEDVPALENAEKKRLLCSAEAEPAAKEEKETLPIEAIETEKDEEILAEAKAEAEAEAVDKKGDTSVVDGKLKESAATPSEAEAEADEKGESDPTSVVDGKLKEATPSEAKIGPKVFTSSMDMFNFFYDLLRTWPLNFNLNKYEHLMLEELINQGHHEPQKKIGAGIESFQVRVNPDFYSRCYYIVRIDGSVDDFSYRKCVDKILPLPEEFKSRSSDLKVGKKNKGHGGPHDNRGRGGRGGGGWGGRRGGGGGHGRGNRGRGGRF